MNSRRRSGGGCCLPLFAGGSCIALGLLLGAILPDDGRAWVRARLPQAVQARLVPPTPTPTPTPTHTPVPTPTPVPEKPLPSQIVIPPRSREIARLYGGIRVRSTLDVQPGRLASQERETPDSYALDLQLQVKQPEAGKTVADLARTAPNLAVSLPKLGKLLEKAEVSKFYFGIYQLKLDLLRQNLTRLDALLSADNFYDTETILELQDPDSKRKALLIQTDMDVDSDGSDADRLNDIDTSDPNYQVETSYKWPKRSAVPSALIKGRQDRIARLENELKTGNPGAARRRDINNGVEAMRADIYQLEHYSSLIAKTDPFIVLPGFMARQNGHPFQPKLGDFAVVLAGDKLYPAIFGDIGPSYKLGEASTRLAQAIDPRATPERSPVDDLKITYLVFPGSADPAPGPPDLGHIRARCQELLNEIGGNQGTLHEWANLIPTPTPTPTPTPLPTPTPTPTPKVSATPTPTPASGAKISATPPASSPSAASTPTPTTPPTPTPIPTPKKP